MACSNHSNRIGGSRKLHATALLALLTAAGALIRQVPQHGKFAIQNPRASTSTQQVVETLGRLPLQFEENRGQAPDDARYVARGRGFTASFTTQQVLLQLDTTRQRPAAQRPCLSLRCGSLNESASGGAVAHAYQQEPTPAPLVRIGWENHGEAQAPHGSGASTARVHYLTGNDSTQWTRDVTLFDRVVYPQVQPGMDLVFYGREQEMEFDLVVAPGADPEAFTMTLDGADSLTLTPQGELRITASGEAFHWKRPLIYQDRSTPGGAFGQRVEIAGSYRIEAGNRVRFDVGDYDRSRTLVIDPVLQYSSYMGGNGSDQIQGIALDSTGNIYVAGSTGSANFPTASALRATKSTGVDMFISKLNPAGTSLIYSTFLGGNGDDVVQRLALFSDGSVTVAGYTSSSNFPTAAPAQATFAGSFDAAITRLNAAGSALIYSTYLGGSGEDAALAVALDSTGAAYITGYTRSTNFPTRNPFRSTGSGDSEAIVAKFAADGASVYSTLLGGNGGEFGLGIAVDSNGVAAIAGTTTSANFPTLNAFQATFAAGTCSDAGNTFPCGDAFVTRLSAGGNSLASSSYLGGTGDDQANALTMDSGGAIFITGYTSSGNFPIRTPLQSTPAGLRDAFVSKVAANGASLVYSTYLGGIVDDIGAAITVDTSGTAYVAGSTESNNFPLVNPLQARAGVDAFVSRLTPVGNAMTYSTFLGGSDFDQALAITADNNGNAYVAGWTNSDDWPVRTPLQSQPGGGNCGVAPLQYICEDGFIARVVHQPGLFVGGMVNGASFAPGAPVAAGGIVSAFGADLAGGLFGASALPLPTNLGGISITMNGTPAPLFFVSGGQVNLQVPWEVAGQNSATIVTSQNGVAISQTTVALAAARPGIFSTNSQGTGQGAILIANTADLVAPVDSIPGRTSRPARRGETITIFATGLGPVSNRPASGAPGPGGPLALTATTPLVSIGGQPATVSFSGLAPGFVGLYQVNVSVPNNSPQNSAVPVVLTIGGVASNTVTIAVQ